MNTNSEFNTIDSFFYPKSIAIVGASDDELKIGGFMFSQIKNHSSIKAYPINAKNSTIQGHRSYASLTQIEGEIDVCIIAIPKQFVFQTLEECAKKNISKVVIISAGFKELGGDGIEEENAIKQFCKKNNITLIGPNCLGFLNPELQLNASFAKDIPKFGDIALISQSGAVLDAIIDWSFTHNIGFSKIVSIGNMAGVNAYGFLEYLNEDPKTHSIVFYLESLEEGEKFRELLSKVTPKKPVFILQPGKSTNAQKAIGSHTGSLAHNYELVKTIYEYSNAILVEGFDELFAHLIALKSSKKPQGNSILIVTNAGGPGVIATDSLEEFALNRYELSDDEKQLFSTMPKASSLNNPIDILGDADPKRYQEALQAAIQTQADGLLILLTPQMMTNSKAIAQSIIEVDKKSKKPIYCCFLGDKEVKDALSYFDLTKIPYFSSPKSALKSYATLYNYFTSTPLQCQSTSKIPSQTSLKLLHNEHITKGLLSQEKTLEIVKSLNLNIPKTYLINSSHDIYTTSFDENLTYFVKADNILHKKDVGAVKPHISYDQLVPTLEEMYATFSKENKDLTLFVQEEIKGVETIVGLKCDEQLGNFLVFGSGGTAVSLFKDIAFSPTPMNRAMSEKCVQSTKVFTLLNGYRGENKCNIEELYNTIESISQLPQLYNNLKEVDCNPVIVNEKGAYLVDIKLLF